MTGQHKPWTFEALAQQEREILESLLLHGKAPTGQQVVGFQFRGWNVNPAVGVYWVTRA